jgi:hypothetical protein
VWCNNLSIFNRVKIPFFWFNNRCVDWIRKEEIHILIPACKKINPTHLHSIKLKTLIQLLFFKVESFVCISIPFHFAYKPYENSKEKKSFDKGTQCLKKKQHTTHGGGGNQEKKGKKLNEAEMELRNKIKEKKNIKLMIILKEK